ncbi:MAG: hypothetical protein AB2689_24870 [Candidatus Thiodiazotropha taylori]
MNSKAIFGVLDQALQSLINFSVGLFFINYSTKIVFGYYSLAYATILLVIGFSNAIVNTQMTVRAHNLKGEEFDRFCGYMFLQLVFGSALVFLLFFLVGIFVYQFLSSDFGLYISIIGFAIPGYVILEFTRRYYYLKNLSRMVLTMDIVYIIILCVVGIPSFIYIDYQLHYAYFFLTGLLALFVSLWFLLRNDIVININLNSMYHAVKESWSGGVWSSLGIITTWGQAQGYTIIISGTLGAQALAELNAARILFAPVMLLSTGIMKVYMPDFSKHYIHGYVDKLVLQARYVLIIVLSLSAIYIVFILSYYDGISNIVFSSEYQGIKYLVGFWAVYYLVLALRTNKSVLMQVFRKFKQITMIGFFVTPLIIIFSLLSTYIIGLEGVLVSMIMGELLFAYILNHKLLTIRKELLCYKI